MQKYLRRCKARAWKSEQDEEFLKCWKLKRIIEAELIGAPVPVDLTMEEFVDADASIQVVEYNLQLYVSRNGRPQG